MHVHKTYFFIPSKGPLAVATILVLVLINNHSVMYFPIINLIL